MANQDAAFGMRPVGRIGGMPFTGGQSRYRIAADYGTSIFQGDMVMQVTGGGVEVHADGGTVPIVGVFNGCSYTDPTTKEQKFSNFYPASTNASDIIAFIIDDPMVIFEVQCNAAFPVADLLGNFDIVYTSAGSTTTGISGAELNVSDGNTTATLPLKAIDISQDPENSDVSSDATNVHVVIQNHIFGQKSAGLA
ncbi:MAG: hypothetical protein CBC24_08390 [Candidatus Pelagibacter sp. TMED64]|jgi:hypothetical protein|nr:MAG: hypothetical protein CBC24_08390 [Candidatus Pelagibacter sp. TMED64]|tara:strand:- start:3228 stop:3812 length:585 start_codon:yes stop_codon:yes gene_type:complete